MSHDQITGTTLEKLENMQRMEQMNGMQQYTSNNQMQDPRMGYPIMVNGVQPGMYPGMQPGQGPVGPGGPGMHQGVPQQMQQQMQQQKSMQELAKDISNQFADDLFTEEPIKIKSEDKINKDKWLDTIPGLIREPFILMFIYVILSQPVVRGLFGKYFAQLNPGNDGETPLIGIIIYGLILSVTFMLVKKFY